jgi:tetratricopeptide (TPR) repeat protein
MPFSSNAGKQCILAFCAFAIVGCGRTPQYYIERGNRFAETRKYDDAALQYKRAIQNAPALGEPHYRLGLLDLKRNEPLAAYQELKIAVELMPGNDAALAELGQLALRLYNADAKHSPQLYATAAQAAERLLSRKPEGFDGNLIKGAIALDDRKLADAIELLRKAVQAKPDDFGAQLGLARALVADNQAPAGVGLAQELIRKNKAFGPAYDFLYGQYQIAGEKENAENLLKLKIENNPKQAAFILELARHYAALQKPAEVAATIERLTASSADFPDGRLLAGDFYMATGRVDLALQQYQLGMASASGKKNLYRKGMVPIFVSRRQWPEVYQQLEAVLKDNPGDEDAKLMRALAWLDEGKPENLDRAIAGLREQSSRHPRDPVLHFRIGSGLARKGDWEGAQREWTAAAQADRNYLPARSALVNLYLARGKAADALRISDEIVAIAPGNVQASLVHVTCLTAAGDYQNARTELNRLASRFPQSQHVRFQLGMLAMAEHKYKEAENVFRKIETTLPREPQVLGGLAEAFVGQNEGAKAIQILQNEVKRNPKSLQLRQLLARMAAFAGKYDIAIDQYKQLAAATPGSTDFQILLAAAYTGKGDVVNAQAALEKVIQADPKSVLASLMLSRTLLATGRVAEAKACYRRALEVQPNNPSALNDLAYLMAESGENLDQALVYVQRGLRNTAEPSLKASLSDTLGWIYLKKNMNDSALQTFQVLVKSNPDNAAFRYHLGATFYQNGDKQKARVELEAALAAGPGASDEEKIRQLLARL